MAYRKKSNVPPREDVRRKIARSTGATAVTYMNRSKLREPLEKPAAKKYFEAGNARAAACRAHWKKQRAAARGKAGR